MKYVISKSEYEPIVILGNTFHSELSKAFIGGVKSAGHMRITEGKVEVYGKSVGLNLEAKPEDAHIISVFLGINN